MKKLLLVDESELDPQNEFKVGVEITPEMLLEVFLNLLKFHAGYAELITPADIAAALEEIKP